MKSNFLLSIVFLAMSSLLLTEKSHSFDHSHRLWTETLKEYQDQEGLVAYDKLKSDLIQKKDHAFHQYLKYLKSVKLKEYEGFSREEKMAFLINSYNALTFRLILDHYPVKSIKDIGGFFTKPWKMKFFSLLDGKLESLDPIEHDWLRPQFKDYRIHAAVNCASISCPALRKEAFVAHRLNEQLDDQMSIWINDPSRNQVSAKLKVWKLSKIFDWYEKDFVDWGGGVKAVVSKHLKTSVSSEELEKIKVDYLSYDWSLNHRLAVEK